MKNKYFKKNIMDNLAGKVNINDGFEKMTIIYEISEKIIKCIQLLK